MNKHRERLVDLVCDRDGLVDALLAKPAPQMPLDDAVLDNLFGGKIGPGDLTTEQTEALISQPAALLVLSSVVHEEWPDPWWPDMARRGQRLGLSDSLPQLVLPEFLEGDVEPVGSLGPVRRGKRIPHHKQAGLLERVWTEPVPTDWKGFQSESGPIRVELMAFAQSEDREFRWAVAVSGVRQPDELSAQWILPPQCSLTTLPNLTTTQQQAIHLAVDGSPARRETDHGHDVWSLPWGGPAWFVTLCVGKSVDEDFVSASQVQLRLRWANWGEVLIQRRLGPSRWDAAIRAWVTAPEGNQAVTASEEKQAARTFMSGMRNGDNPENLMQEAWGRLVLRRHAEPLEEENGGSGKVANGTEFLNRLRRTASNLQRDARRRARRLQPFGSSSAGEEADLLHQVPDRPHGRQEQAAQLIALIEEAAVSRGITDHDMRVVRDHYGNGRTFREIAQEDFVSASTICRRANTTLETLRNLCQESDNLREGYSEFLRRFQHDR